MPSPTRPSQKILSLDIEGRMSEALETRRGKNAYRILPVENDLVDFCSNDFLGFARSNEFRDRILRFEEAYVRYPVGATGSRLVSGNHALYEKVETQVAKFHRAASGLIFNSGYTANTGLFSCLPQAGDTVIHDALIHPSVADGIRSGPGIGMPFKHNDSDDLAANLEVAGGPCLVAVNSVYSMDGDCCPLPEILEVCERAGAPLIVDEAHATGVIGPGGRGLVCEEGLEERILARVHTFGKAMGSHGAIILGSPTLISYLTNFSAPLIYSTALALHTLLSIKAGYELLGADQRCLEKLRGNIEFFSREAPPSVKERLIPSRSAIQCVLLPGNDRAMAAASKCGDSGYDVKAVLHPAVPRGRERIRICLHAYNSYKEMRGILRVLAGC
jgi:8-amino-7-oxononanoate synthase